MNLEIYQDKKHFRNFWSIFIKLAQKMRYRLLNTSCKFHQNPFINKDFFSIRQSIENTMAERRTLTLFSPLRIYSRYQNFWRFAPKIRRSEFCASRKIRQLLRFFKAYRRFAPVSVLLQICQLLRFKIIKINIVLLKDSFMKKVMYCQMAMLFLTGSVQNKPFMHCLYFYQLLGSPISKTNRAISTKF